MRCKACFVLVVVDYLHLHLLIVQSWVLRLEYLCFV